MRGCFLVILTKMVSPDIMVSMDTGGSGGYRIFYIYYFRNSILRELFNGDNYDEEVDIRSKL